jgi:DNA-binding Lrp family transcriptional regulator
MRAKSDINARAYVLIEAETGYIGTALAALRDLPMVVAADAVVGPCDIIAKISAPEQGSIGRLLIDKIHAIPGVKRTTTCVAIQ